MKISRIRLKKNEDPILKELDGLKLKQAKMDSLGDVVILAGSNGSGKSRLLKLLEKYVAIYKKSMAGVPLSDTELCLKGNMEILFKDQDGNELDHAKAISNITLINYSHYDIPLQLPDEFPSYVISMAEKNLEKCDFERTANEALLYIQNLYKYRKDKDNIETFNSLVSLLLGVNSNINENKNLNNNEKLKLFGQRLSKAPLSPGQQYLLRMCVALHCNIIANDYYILFLDEPETHLHPEALLILIDKIRQKFGKGQIWIATHSIALLSMFYSPDIWYMESGEAKKLGSKSAPLIKGLIGDESNRFKLQEFINSPIIFACNVFAFECLLDPLTLPYKEKDRQIQITAELLKDNPVIVDFGAAKGRLIEGIATDFPKLLKKINYYAYDNSAKDSDECKKVMDSHGFSIDNYCNSFEDLKLKLLDIGLSDYVLMVNVIHEISPNEWPAIFEDIYSLLKDDGSLIIVELEEISIGEQPYTDGFLVIPEEAIQLLNSYNEQVICKRHLENNRIIRYQIPKRLLLKMTKEQTRQIVNKTSCIALEHITSIKNSEKTPENLFEYGIKLAFWTHEFANAQLALPILSDTS